jgi:phage gpG-like protein
MAWVQMRIRNIGAIHRRFKGITDSLEQTGRLLSQIGVQKVADIRRKFLTGGPGWRGLSKVYLNSGSSLRGLRPQPVRPLLRTGRLMRSPRITAVDNSTLRLATSTPYAALHNSGAITKGWKIPKRVFMEWTKADRVHVHKRVRDNVRYGLTGNQG